MKFRLVIAAMFVAMSLQAEACDVCATHVALTGKEAAGATTLSLFQRYSYYSAPDHGGHGLKSSSTQLAVAYWLTERWALQLGIPILYRNMEGWSEQGLGDATALAFYRAFDRQQNVNRVIVDVYAGVKMPTGNTDPLRYEQNHRHHEHSHAHSRHHGGHHGHSLHHHASEHRHGGHHVALGTGSWDYLFGGKVVAKLDLHLLTAESQYNLRTEGDYGWQHGDEWTWRLGGHHYVVLDMERSLSLGVELSGEWRSENKLDGVKRAGSDKTGTYVGPLVRYTHGDSLNLSAGLDLPISDRNKGTGGAADYRIYGNLAWSF